MAYPTPASSHLSPSPLLPTHEHTKDLTYTESKIEKLQQMLLSGETPSLAEVLREALSNLQNEQNQCLDTLLRLNGVFYQDPRAELKKAWDAVVSAVQIVFHRRITNRSELDALSAQLSATPVAPSVSAAQTAIQRLVALEQERNAMQSKIHAIMCRRQTLLRASETELIQEAREQTKRQHARVCRDYFQHFSQELHRQGQTAQTIHPSLPTVSKKAAIHLLTTKATQTGSFVQKMYYGELSSAVNALANNVCVAGFLASIDQTTTRLEALEAMASANVDHLTSKLQSQDPATLIPEADQLYRSSIELLNTLKNLPGTNVQRALYTGRIVSIFRRLDDAFSDRYQETLHRYCGCHIKAAGEDGGLKMLAPGIQGRDPKFLVNHQTQEAHGDIPPHTSVVLMSQSYGSGHNVVQQAMSQRLARRGGHAYKVEADEEVLEAYYNYRKWTGSSGAEWASWALKNNYFRFIRFTDWISSGKDSVRSREAKVSFFALSLLARGQQDLAMMCFQRNTSPAEKAASRLGTGLYEIATDLDFKVFDFSKDVENPHFKHGMMASDPEKEKQILQKSLEAHQFTEIGFPVRDPFLKRYTPEELQAIREKYRRAYNLAPDARVVILLCGGEGIPNTIAETLSDKYPANGPKMHLFAICGKNAQKQQLLTSKFQQLNRPNFQATALGWTEETALGELFAMGALEQNKGLLISAKAGGGTVSEGIARGIPMLISEQSGISHEKMNLDFLVQKRLGKAFNRERELPKKVAEMLSNPLTPALSATSQEAYSDYRSEEKSMHLVNTMVQECRNDAAFQMRHNNLMKKLPKALDLQALRQDPAPIVALLRNYGWDDKGLLSEALMSRPRYGVFLKFLYDSRLIFSIRGYESSLQDSSSDMKEGITMIEGQPHILKQGKWVIWSHIIDELGHSSAAGIISHGTKTPWVYSYPNGLMPQPPTHLITPVHQLSPKELTRLHAHSQKFFAGQENAPILRQEECAYVQVFTNQEGDLFDRMGHTAVRLIDKEGRVYSVGLKRLPTEGRGKRGGRTLLSTFNAEISLHDYKEFAKFNSRAVTTIPVNLATFDRILAKAQADAATPLNHNYLDQNCLAFTTSVLREAGLNIDTKCDSAVVAALQVLAPKWMRKAAHSISRAYNTLLPKWIKNPIALFLTPFSLLSTLSKNLILLSLGAGKPGTSLKSGHKPSNSLFPTWASLFKDHPIDITYKLIDWQMKQGSTHTHSFEGPKLYIVP